MKLVSYFNILFNYFIKNNNIFYKDRFESWSGQGEPRSITHCSNFGYFLWERCWWRSTDLGSKHWERNWEWRWRFSRSWKLGSISLVWSTRSGPDKYFISCTIWVVIYESYSINHWYWVLSGQTDRGDVLKIDDVSFRHNFSIERSMASIPTSSTDLDPRWAGLKLF